VLFDPLASGAGNGAALGRALGSIPFGRMPADSVPHFCKIR
jgi:hypothetical protein